RLHTSSTRDWSSDVCSSGSLPILPAGTALVTKATQIIPGVAKEIGKPHYIEAIGPPAIDIFIFIPFHRSCSAHVVMMIHDVMTQIGRAHSELQSRVDLVCRL